MAKVSDQRILHGLRLRTGIEEALRCRPRSHEALRYGGIGNAVEAAALLQGWADDRVVEGLCSSFRGVGSRAVAGRCVGVECGGYGCLAR